MHGSQTPLEFGDLVVDLGAWEVRLRGAPIELTKTEFELLVALAARPRRVVTNEDLTQILWGGNWYGDDGNLAVHISKLRGKLGESGIEPRYIRTVRGVGYRFEPDPEGYRDTWIGAAEARGLMSVSLMMSTDRTMHWVSPQVRELLGWEPEDLLGTTPMGLLHPEDASTALAARARLESGEPVSFQARMRMSSGDYRVLTHTVRPIHHAGGAVAGFLGEWQPVAGTLPQVALQSIVLAPAQVPSIPVTLAYDADFILVDVSPRMPIGGWEPEEIIGRYFSTTGRGESAARKLAQALVSAGVRMIEGVENLRCRDGSLIPVRNSTQIDLDDDGAFAGYRATVFLPA